MLTDLSRGDFDYLVSYSTKMRTCHDSEFMNEIDPDLIRAFYRGRKVKDTRFQRINPGWSGADSDNHILMLSTIFSAANTILPNLYYQNPNPIITALKGATPDSAALLTALIKYYMKVNKAKQENQDAVLNGYFFGLGWKKIGYHVAQDPMEVAQDEPENVPAPNTSSFSLMKLLKGEQSKPDTLQSKPRMDFDQDEGIVNSSESPLNVMLDHKSDLLNCKALLHRLPRTLYELMSFGGYDKDSLESLYKKHRHAKGSRMDTREIDLVLNELHVRQKNGIWILTWVEGFDKPLQYEMSTWQGKGFQFEPLVLTNEPGVRYPISHMKIAVQSQDKIDKMATTFYENVSRAMNLTFINERDLKKGMVEAIRDNRTKGIILTDKPINGGTLQHVQSPSVQNDLPTLIKMCQQNLIEVMGTDSQAVSGRSSNKTLGQDELAAAGTKVRESGMQDRVRDWMINQFTKEAKLLQQYSDATLELEITGGDYADPIMAGKAQRQQAEFMTMANPIGAKNEIKGEYKYDVNIEEAVKPDNELIRGGIERIIATYGNPLIRQEVNNDGKRLRVGLLWNEWLDTFDILGNPGRYLEDIDSMQLAAMQARDFIMNGGGGSTVAPKVPPQPQGKSPRGKQPMEQEPQPAGVGI